MKSLILAIAGVAIAACAASNDTRPAAAPYASAPYSTTQTTSGNPDIVGGEGYGGTTEYGMTNGPQGEPSKAEQYATRDGGVSRAKDQNGGDVFHDSIAR